MGSPCKRYFRGALGDFRLKPVLRTNQLNSRHTLNNKMTFFLIVAFLIGIWWLLSWLDSLEPSGITSEYPPISDDEFVAKCDPGTSRDVALGVRRVISESLGVPYESIYPEHRIVEDLGAE